MSVRVRLVTLSLLSVLTIVLSGALSFAPGASASVHRAPVRSQSTPASSALTRYFDARAGLTGLPRPQSTSSGRVGFGSARVGVAPTQQYPASIAVDKKTDTIYVADGYDPDSPPSGGDTVTVVNGRHCKAADVSRCKGPWPTVKVGNLPSTLAIDQATNTIYVTNFADGTVSVIDGATCDAEVSSGCGQVTPTIDFGANSGPIGIVADHANHSVYVGLPGTSFSQSNVGIIDTSHCNATDLSGCSSQTPPTFTVGVGPSDLALNSATHTVYIAQFENIAAFNASTCNASVMTGCSHIGSTRKLQKYQCGDCAEFAVAVDQANNTIYAADGSQDAVSVLNGRTCDAADLGGCHTHKLGTVTIGPINEIEGVIWLAVDAPAHTVYAVNHKDDDVSVINTDACDGAHLAACSRQRPQTIHTGTNPQSVAVNPQTQTVYVGNFYDHDLAVIAARKCDANTTTGCRHPAPTVNAGPGPGDVAIDQAVHTAYVTDGGTQRTVGSTISMIDVARCHAGRTAGCVRHPVSAHVHALPVAVGIDSRTHTAYVASIGRTPKGWLSVIDASACNATRHSGCRRTRVVKVANGNPVAVAVNAKTDTVYVGVDPKTGRSLIDVYNGASCRAADTRGCSHSPAVIRFGVPGYGINGLAIDQATNTVYATESAGLGGGLAGNELYVINGASCDGADHSGCHHSPASTKVGLTPEGVAVDQATDTVYVADLQNGEGRGEVSVVNGATCNGTDTSGCSTHAAVTARAGFGTDGVAIDAATNRIYATGDEDTSVTVINGAICNGSHVAGCRRHASVKIAVGNFPLLLAVDHAEHTVYVIDNLQTSLTLIRTAR